MQVLETTAELNDYRAHLLGERIGFVPTMGNLHAGHEALMQAARQKNSIVIASIFVNPLQFGPSEDFASYPRTFDQDCKKLAASGVDAVFAPSVEQMYPQRGGLATSISLGPISNILCGQFRPGHFEGVATVVTKLLNMVRPDTIYFGEKDYQQLAVISQVVADLSQGVEVIGVPTVREADGLALSSRNRYLNAQQREQAPLLAQTIRECLAALKRGQRNFVQLEQQAMAQLTAAGFKPDYFSIRSADLSAPSADTQVFRVLAAAYLGQARLIDNMGLTLDHNV